MSELNRLLSEIVSPECKDNKVSVASVPKSTGFVFARISLVTVAVLMSASGIAWAISTVSEITKSTGVFDMGSGGLSQPAMASPPDFIAQTSPTTRINLGDMHFVSPDKLEEAIPRQAVSSSVAPRRLDTSQPFEIAAVSTPPAISSSPVPAPINQVSNMEIETVELSASELAKMNYKDAQKYTRDGDSQRAISALYTAVKYNPRHVGANNQLAALLYGRGQVLDAERVLRKAIQENPSSSALKLTLARMYQQGGREEAALNILTTPQDRLDDNQINVVSMRAALAQKLGNSDLAQTSYRWLSIQEPTEGRWWLGLAVSTERKKAPRRALWAYETALSAGGLSNQSVDFARQRIQLIQNKLNEGVVNDGETEKASR